MSSTITSREFNRDLSAAKRASEGGPVTITDRGRRSHVLLTAKDFDRPAGTGQLVGDRLWSRGIEDLDLEIPERRVEAPRESSLYYLLDTNILSDARRRRSTPLMGWLQDQEVGARCLSVVSVLELERGVRLDEDVKPMFVGRILPIDERTAITAASLRVPDPRSEMDALIAATAIAHDLVLVSHNTKELPGDRVTLLDPWESRA